MLFLTLQWHSRVYEETLNVNSKIAQTMQNIWNFIVRQLSLQEMGKLRQLFRWFQTLIWRPGDTVQNLESHGLSRRVDSTVYDSDPIECTEKGLSGKVPRFHSLEDEIFSVKQWKENSLSLRNQLTVGTPPLLSLWNDIWGMSAAEIPSDELSPQRSRVLNKSQQPAKFAGYFTLTGRLLFFRNFRQKSQNLVMSVLCSHYFNFCSRMLEMYSKSPPARHP